MWQLRDAIDEADDLLDEFEYMKHKEELANNMEQTKVRPSIPGFLYRKLRKIVKLGEIRGNDPNLERLEEVVQKLDKVSAEVGTFLHLLESTKQEQRELQLELHEARETGSLPTNHLIGRGKDKEFVIQWLRKPSNEERQTTNLYKNISLLSIVGHGGMGKTTLLQHVYEDEMKNEFDLKMWVCGSNNFDAKRVIADMLESLTKNRPHLESLNALQNSLKAEVISKKFLLVLDDVWEEGEDKWKKVLAPLAYGSLGSKILITTRMGFVALTLANVIQKKEETWRLEGMEEDECLQLLNTRAFANVENPDDHQKLRSIAGEMVKKLFGSPLAAKVMGGVLNSSLDERHWTKVLNSDFRSAESSQNTIFPILKLSYIFLPKYLHNCFAFCCIFRQDHTFDKNDLVQMWIAVGFIQQSSIPGETLEDVGGRYFDILVKKSFFEEVDAKHYKMHDLLHELAQSVSTHECFRVAGNKNLPLKIPETIRHLSVGTSNLEVVRKICRFKKLRTLCITYDNKDDYDSQAFFNALTEIFEEARSIRSLYIFSSQLKKIPEEIEYLTHLRYFSLYFSDIRQWPRSLSNLYHLQFIKLPVFYSKVSDDFFPRDMHNLFNLHYLCLPEYQFPEIGKLKLLQELNPFHVHNENGYRIGELEHMNDLRLLTIRFDSNVREADEACNARLYNKRNLTNLSLDWGIPATGRNTIDSDLQERMLNNLQPHNSLKALTVKGYMGAKFAIWMSKAHSISNLEHVQLEHCMELQTLPPFAHLHFLKSLVLYDMPKAKRFDDKLEDWFDAGIMAEDDCLFPRLTKLVLKGCPKLQELPYLPPNLKELVIKSIGWKALNFCNNSKSIPLETLEIFYCPNITHVFLARKICRFTALREVKISLCPKLISLGGYQEVDAAENCQIAHNDLIINDPSNLTSITSTRNLKIMDNDFSFEAGRMELPSLSELHLEYLKNLICLPSSLPSFSSLISLIIIEVPNLRELPNLPPFLKKIKIEDCHPELMKRYEEFSVSKHSL